MKLFRNLSAKVLAVTATVFTVFGVAASVNAFFPDRPTYTTAVPADHVTFNSIVDNPREGDERAFFEVKDAKNTASDGFLHTATVYDGEELLIRAYVHNNAADNLNTVPDGNGGFKGVAKNAKIRVFLPNVTDSVMRLNAYISADNAIPKEVSDTLDLNAQNSNQKFSISYVPGSAVAYNNAHTAKDANGTPVGMPLSDSIVTSGAPLGYESANGLIPGCFQYVNVVTLRVKVKLQNPGFQVEKYVAKVGDDGWSKSVTAKPGEKVHYELRLKNTGNVQLSDVVARDILPKGVKIVPGSVKLYNTNYPSGTKLSDAVTTDGGSNIGAYGPLSAADQSKGLSSAMVDFDATLPNEDELQCGQNKLTNVGQFLTGGLDGTDTADVIVNKVCAETPAYSCDLFTITKDVNRTVKVTDFKQTTKNGATFKLVSIDWGDGSSTLQTDAPVNKTHQYAADGTYNITTTAHFSVNGVDVTNTNTSCAQSVSYTTTPTTPTTPTRPTTLVNTGAGDVAALFAGVAVLTAFAHRLFLGRRISA